ncbi:hypothetical protein [Armatimonas sp.]|uniref:hypothetical protein n=1 Tax=Armatimonas sp. TaxID=1872638 RepID=UPI00374CF5C9
MRLFWLFLAVLLAGCAGTQRAAAPPTRGIGTAELVIEFPKTKGRVMPSATQSVVVSVSGILLDKVYTRVVNRPSSTDTVRVQLLLPSGSLALTAKAYSQAEGVGSVLASGSKNFELLPDEVKAVDLELSVPIAGRRFRKKLVQITTNPAVEDRLPTPGFPDRFTSRLELTDMPEEIVLGVPFDLKPRWELTLVAGHDWPSGTTADMRIVGTNVTSGLDWTEKKTVGSVVKGASAQVLLQGTRSVTVTFAEPQNLTSLSRIFYDVAVKILPSDTGGGTGFATYVRVEYEYVE